MKKEELTNLKLTEEQIEEIFKLNGRDVNAAKETAKNELQPTIDSLNNQIKTAQDGLKKFEGIDPEKLNNEIQNLNNQLASQKADFDKQIADRDFNDLLSSSINSFKGKNAKAITALLDVDTLKASKNQKIDIEKAIETVKKDNDYLFDSDEPHKNPVGGTGGQGGNGGSSASLAAIRAAIGLPAEKK